MAEKANPPTLKRLRSYDDVFYRGGYELGTTTHGFIFNDEWLMVALDHPSGEVPPANVSLLNSHLLAAFSGGSESSREYLLNLLPNKCRELQLKKGREASAAEASKWLAEFLSLHLDTSCSFSLCILIAGWEESGPSLYKVKGNGRRLEVRGSSAGTGCAAGCSSIIKNMLSDDNKDITVDKAKEWAKKTLCMSVYHAHECGECVSVYYVGRPGVELVVSNENIMKLQKRYLREVGRKWEDLRKYNKARALGMGLELRKASAS
ncbi:OLC1v1002721C1 [Oldenlandia corymbosa var. corymbosa]|uniref:OLC1v1002721C1 n=1 Tax=Oldenlandia corymbosa var. corymbosa TaxID=529605 RepID=A0AAV1D8Z3_OLDCO|nr:OLC1v1002721C1 [Oldenlandia corymbosa var. corymbosa]